MSENQKPHEYLVRPVTCWFCKRPMYYSGDERHEPEVRVEVHRNYVPLSEFYAHEECWNKEITPKE
jgi:hypothetical protein